MGWRSDVCSSDLLIATPLISAQANARSVHTERAVRYDGHGHRTVVKTERARQGGHTVKRSVVRKYQPAYASHKWAKGQRFDRRHASNYRVIDSPRAYHPRPATCGPQWVSPGNEAGRIAMGRGIRRERSR